MTGPFPLAAQRSAAGAVLDREATSLSVDQVEFLASEAVSTWTDLGVAAAAFDGVEFVVVDLDGDLLGAYSANPATIYIDSNAAGHGWFVDPTPGDASEFTADDGPEGMDLLTLMTHELGHHLGLADEFDMDDSLMDALLPTGQRRGVSPDDVDSALAGW